MNRRRGLIAAFLSLQLKAFGTSWLRAHELRTGPNYYTVGVHYCGEVHSAISHYGDNPKAIGHTFADKICGGTEYPRPAGHLSVRMQLWRNGKFYSQSRDTAFNGDKEAGVTQTFGADYPYGAWTALTESRALDSNTGTWFGGYLSSPGHNI